MDLADIIRWISKNHIAAILTFVVVSALWEWISKQIARGRTPPPKRSRKPADPVLRPSAEPAPPTQVPTPASRVCQTAAGPLHTADTSDPADAVDSDSALRAGSRRGFHRDLPLRAGPGSHGCDPPLENTGGIS